VNVNLKIAAICLSWVAPVLAQQSLESNFRVAGAAVTAAFEAQRQVLQTSSALVADGRQEIAYGVVLTADGYILTKASEIREAKALNVTIDHTKFSEVKVVLEDLQWDVALLKVVASDLTPVVYAETSEVPQGTWVVANGASSRSQRRLLAGIISAKIREIPAAGGAVLGVTLAENAKALEIGDVNPRGGAKEAGLQAGDVILTIEGKAVSKVEQITEILKDRKEGSRVKVTYRRKKLEQTAEVRLAAKAELFTELTTRNDQMSGDFSLRRSGFPRVMQHDILGSREIEGGPLLDLDGRCIGMNIARASRAENYAIPVENLKEIATKMLKQASP
jgi:serine protease Do